MNSSNFWKRNIWDILFTIIFSGSAIALFIMEINAAQLSQLDDALFGALEFMLSIAGGFFLQRIASREEFQRSLRQYALSAYRRITDIRKSMSRLHYEIVRMRTSHPEESVHELDVLGILADEVRNTVNSSVYDWADIIGDEIRKAERIGELQAEIRSTQSPVQPFESPETAEKMKSLQNEIDSLRSELPMFLEMAARGQEEILPREGRHSTCLYQHYRESMESQGAIYLMVRPLIERSPENVERIENGSPYQIMEDPAMSTWHVALLDSEGEWIGEVLNPFEEAGVYHNDFTFTLFEILASNFSLNPAQGAPPAMILTGSEFVGYSSDGGKFFVRVPIQGTD